MKNIRIIPRLDVKNDTIVKGIHLEGLRVVGKPQELALKYYENGADELLYMDAVASLYERNSLHEIISKTAREIFIPITVSLSKIRAGRSNHICMLLSIVKCFRYLGSLLKKRARNSGPTS